MLRNVFVFFLLLTVLLAQSQVDPFPRDTMEVRLWGQFKYDIQNIFGGMGYTFTRPLHWQKGQWLTFGGVVAGTMAFYAIDDEAERWFVNQEPHIPQWVQDYGWYYGNPQNNYALTGVVYLTGLFTRNEIIQRTGVLMISSASAAGLLQQLSKSVVGRARPRSGLAKNHFRPFDRDSDFHSFPSGHTALAFSNAHALAKQFRNPWLKGGIYLLGTVPPMTRLWDGAHWLTDIVLSMALSIATVEAVDRYLDKRYGSVAQQEKRRKTKKISWNLLIRPNGAKVVGSF